MLEIETLHTFDTEYSADSVEWCPVDGCEDYFVVGTYQLEEKDEDVSSNNTRKGRIYLFEYNQELDELKMCQQIETEAILDQKWKDRCLITATSLGNIQKYSFDSNHELSKLCEVNLGFEGVENLVLSVDIDKATSRLLASDSQGRLSLVDMEKEQPIMQQWQAHEFEAWTCAFDQFNDHVVFSGGDDAKLNIWDLRTSAKVKSSTRDAGVTSLYSQKENILLVGSYDEKLFVNDLRNLKRPVNEINLQGGIWRIKPSKTDENLLLVACMYHNFSIIDSKKELKLVGEFFGHESICYGCDWAPKPSTASHQIFSSCSFYDHKLSVCKVKL